MMEFWNLLLSSFWAWAGITFFFALTFGMILKGWAMIVYIVLTRKWPEDE